MAELLSTRGKNVRKRNTAAVQGEGQLVGVDPVCLPAMLANTDLSDPSRVHQQRILSPLTEFRVHCPRLAARLDRDARRLGPRAEKRQQAREVSRRRTLDDGAVLRFAVADLCDAQI